MKILFAGDIFVKENDFALSDEIQQLFDECDIRICNFEAPIANPEDDKPIKKAGAAIFQTNRTIDLLKKAGFNLVSLANNHVMDYGKPGLTKTIDSFNKENIPYIGAGTSFTDAYRPYIYNHGRQKIAFIAGSQAEFGVFKTKNDTAGYAWINHPYIDQLIKQTKREVDYLYILPHAGLENIPYPLPEWRARYKEMLDAGADCIIGGHPHIVQGYEVYNNKHIFYSLGNFFFDMKSAYPEEANRGIIIISDIDCISDYQIIPYVVDNNVIKIDTSDTTNKAVQDRSKILTDEVLYQDKIDKIAEELWHQIYINYYLWYNKMDITKMKLKDIVKYLLKKLLKKDIANANIINETLLLHNIQIETHRWIVERYLYNQNKKSNAF
jgi:poly-gamma-glutamate synthesis protein (capsule biosynthesis protein)